MTAFNCNLKLLLSSDGTVVPHAVSFKFFLKTFNQLRSLEKNVSLLKRICIS